VAEKGNRGAYLNTGRNFAVVTSKYGKMTAGIWKFPLLDVLHPCPIYTNGNIVLFLARNRTGVTADTAILVNDKTVTHFLTLSDVLIDTAV
jgi:hypothetical protein